MQEQGDEVVRMVPRRGRVHDNVPIPSRLAHDAQVSSDSPGRVGWGGHRVGGMAGMMHLPHAHDIERIHASR